MAPSHYQEFYTEDLSDHGDKQYLSQNLQNGKSNVHSKK